MMQKIQALQSTVGKELSGLQLMALFMRMRIQPLQARAHQMWNYAGSADETRVSKDDVAEDEVKKAVRRLTNLTTADEVPIACQAECLDKDHPLPLDHRFLSSLPSLPEGGNVPEAAVVTESEAADTGATPEVDDDDEEDAHSEASHTKASPPSATSHGEEEVQKKRKRMEIADDSELSGESIPAAFPSSSYADDPFTMAQILSKGERLQTELHASDEDAGLDDFVVAKVTDPLATTAESSKPDDFDESPRALAKKKAKTLGALKGILISSAPSSPPRDHPFTREMLDVAAHFIGLEAENKLLRSDYELEHSRVNIMADKLKAAEEALEEVKASLAAAEQRLEDEKSVRETREGDIRKRLEAFNTSLLKRTEHPTILLDKEKVDPTFDALKLLEGNSIYGRNVINNCRKVVVRLHGHVFPTEKLAEDYDLLELVRKFAAPVDPLINYRRE
ncbi:hypothetical protein ACQ4PT_046947 [Festuca glaucescens]